MFWLFGRPSAPLFRLRSLIYLAYFFGGRLFAKLDQFFAFPDLIRPDVADRRFDNDVGAIVLVF